MAEDVVVQPDDSYLSTQELFSQMFERRGRLAEDSDKEVAGSIKEDQSDGQIRK